MKPRLFAASVLLAAGTVAWAAVLTGPIVHLPESGGMFWWGDGIHDLGEEWSVNNPNSSGWFYGSSYGWSTADVYVYSGLKDPTTVADATVFTYTSGVLWAQEGDSVFYRGKNGYYGAWRIDDIYPGSPAYAYLDGQWYFVDDGSGKFTSSYAAGDLNCDGKIDAFDIDPFVLALTDPAGYAAQWPACDWELADINGDGKVDAFDIDPFVDLLTGD